MAVPIRIAGVAFLQRDGVAYALRGSLKIMPLDRTKEGIAGADGVHGYREVPVVPFIEAQVTAASFAVKGLQGVTDSTIRAETADGKVYLLSNAWFAGAAEYEAQEGSVTVRFEGLRCIEINPS
jgi:hypothetical protein